MNNFEYGTREAHQPLFHCANASNFTSKIPSKFALACECLKPTTIDFKKIIRSEFDFPGPTVTQNVSLMTLRTRKN